MAKTKFITLATTTNASVVLTSPTTVDNYTYNGAAQTRSRTPSFGAVEVVNVSGGGVVYFRVDGVNPTVKGDNTFVVPDVKGASLSVPFNGTVATVRMIASAGTDVGVTAK